MVPSLLYPEAVIDESSGEEKGYVCDTVYYCMENGIKSAMTFMIVH
jgi:hypothetical protein